MYRRRYRHAWGVLAMAGIMLGILSAAANDPWTNAASFQVLEPAPLSWGAVWIGPGDAIPADALGKSFLVRKTFHADDPAKFHRAYVSADSQYKLWINGVPVSRGPAKFDPDHQVYETLDLSSVVVRGENVIAAQIMVWGDKTTANPFCQMSRMPGFVFESAELKSDGTWKLLTDTGYDGATPYSRGVAAANWDEYVDGRKIPAGWQAPGFADDAWANADVIDRAEPWGIRSDTWTPWKLVPRTIPAIEEHAPEACVVIQAGAVVGAGDMPRFPADVAPTNETPTLPATVSGDGAVQYLVFDAGRLVNGFTMLDIDAPDGAIVEVTYAEAPSIEGAKDRRDALENRRIEGATDCYVTRAGRQVYEPFWHRTFRFVRVAVKSAEPVTVHSLTYRWTGYAFPERGTFHCSDDTLNRIWEVGWYTQRMCAFDTFQDCPYYERLQYGGDTRIQGLVTLYASGDPRLLANAIRQLHASLLPEGLLYSRYPSNVFQVIPGYSLYWIMMLHDYYLHTGDVTLIKECENGLRAILRFYSDHQKENGFIADLPFWNFYDWTYEHSGVPDAHKENCTLSTIHFKATLDAGAELVDALGDTHQAGVYREQAANIVERVNALAWNEAEGLYTDGIETKTFSQHVNAFAVLFGVADDTKQARIATRLFDDPALRGTTFYFAHYLHETAERLNQPKRILDDMARWKHMIDLGATTWWETPDEPRSECHAWSSTPTYRLMTAVLGVRPMAPGFAEVEIRPYTDTLTWAEGTVPTPKGDIKVRWDNAADLAITVDIPRGIRATVIFPDGAAKTVEGTQATLHAQSN